MADLHSGGVDVKLLEDGEGLLKELIADGDVGDVGRVVVVQPVDVLHHAGAVRLDGRQDQEVLEVSGTSKKKYREAFRTLLKPRARTQLKLFTHYPHPLH